MATNPIVIDVSHHQPDPIDWTRVRHSGTMGVILKATEGVDYEDPTYGVRAAEARNAGLFVSAYHFLRPGDISAQMDSFVATANLPRGGRLVVDFEDPASTFDELEEAVLHLFAMRDYQVTVYGSNVLVDACKGQYSEVLGKTALWQARYSSTPPQVPTNIWPTWSLWQYTDEAIVDGITGPCDANRWNGDPDALANWFQLPEIPDNLITMDIVVPVGSQLRLTINGIEYQT